MWEKQQQQKCLSSKFTTAQQHLTFKYSRTHLSPSHNWVAKTFILQSFGLLLHLDGGQSASQQSTAGFQQPTRRTRWVLRGSSVGSTQRTETAGVWKEGGAAGRIKRKKEGGTLDDVQVTSNRPVLLQNHHHRLSSPRKTSLPVLELWRNQLPNGLRALTTPWEQRLSPTWRWRWTDRRVGGGGEGRQEVSAPPQ